MIGLFKQKTPVNILVIFVLGIAIKFPIFRKTRIPQLDENSAVLYKQIVIFINSFGEKSGFLFAAATYLLLFTQAMQLNKLINVNRMMQRSNFLPATSYLLLTSLLPDWNFFHATLLINSLVLLVFSGLFRLYNQQNVKSTIFNIGLLVGISSFIFFPSVILFGWLIIGLLIMRTVRINEWLICLLGVTAPFYFYAVYLFIIDQWSWHLLLNPFSIKISLPDQSFWLAGSSFLLVIPFLIGGYFVQENLRRMLIQMRKNWSLVLIYLLFTLFIPFLNNDFTGLENWILLAVPFAAFHACTYLYSPQRWLPAVIFWLSVLFILLYQYKGPGW